ncbi:hypothetical protein BP00DRAFT_62840 [Aspergillus indologenus CBS 114.80]|uniref:Uncharacterized protein n=1 Tax=Aspergillus indologenus CBS 114.80 TaxID=1450541 RepID=A0A2V5ID56_9EURO|nr:hypothetical protein BP00DRAFT_62840 [Aspergillus indologenus CBS 114.80]
MPVSLCHSLVAPSHSVCDGAYLVAYIGRLPPRAVYLRSPPNNGSTGFICPIAIRGVGHIRGFVRSMNVRCQSLSMKDANRRSWLGLLHCADYCPLRRCVIQVLSLLQVVSTLIGLLAKAEGFTTCKMSPAL